MAKKGALYSSLFISQRTSSASRLLKLVDFVLKDLNIWRTFMYSSCKSLSKTVSYLARSSMLERKLPVLSFESSSLDPRKGKFYFANINITFTSLSKAFCQKFFFSAKTRATLLLYPLFLYILYSDIYIYIYILISILISIYILTRATLLLLYPCFFLYQTTSANVPLPKTSQRPTVPKSTHGDSALLLLPWDKESNITRNFT